MKRIACAFALCLCSCATPTSAPPPSTAAPTSTSTSSAPAAPAAASPPTPSTSEPAPAATAMVDGKLEKLGSLKPEVIRQIVRGHAGQIRWCYEHELETTPGLYGKIVIKWIINGDGSVRSATVVETQMKSDAVEQCLASRIKGWTFPEPKNNGFVIVTYPFVFKHPPAATTATP